MTPFNPDTAPSPENVSELTLEERIIRFSKEKHGEELGDEKLQETKERLEKILRLSVGDRVEVEINSGKRNQGKIVRIIEENKWGLPDAFVDIDKPVHMGQVNLAGRNFEILE